MFGSFYILLYGTVLKQPSTYYFFAIIVHVLNMQKNISFLDRLKRTRYIITSHVPMGTQSRAFAQRVS